MELCQALDELKRARHFAKEAWKLIQDGCFLDEIEYGNHGTPEFELWCQKWIVIHLADEAPWLDDDGE